MSLTVKDLTVIANRQTFERARAEAMGFTFHNVTVDYALPSRRETLVVNGVFRCVCGREERFMNTMSAILLTHPSLEWVERELDVGAFLRKAGSFDREHLLEDGYTPEQVDAILERGRKFDEQALRALDAVPITVAENAFGYRRVVAFRQPEPPRELASSATHHAREGIKERP